MDFKSQLQAGRLIKRYKRFLADVELEETKEIVTAMVANTGSMTGLKESGLRVWLEHNDKPTRKLRWDWHLAELDTGLVGVNTGFPNGLVEEAIKSGLIDDLGDYNELAREKKYGERSRIDILLTDDAKPDCYVEVKNVHLMRTPRKAEFPDSVTTRGIKHLGELSNMVKQGSRAVMVYAIQREDVDDFTIASDVDPDYAAAAKKAHATGVEFFALKAHVTTSSIVLRQAVPVIL